MTHFMFLESVNLYYLVMLLSQKRQGRPLGNSQNSTILTREIHQWMTNKHIRDGDES